MYGYDENTGFMGPGVDYLQNVVVGTLIKRLVTEPYSHKGTFYTFGYNGNWTQGEYIGGVICYSKNYNHLSMRVGDTQELAVWSRNKRECLLKYIVVNYYHNIFIVGVVFLSLCLFLILVIFANILRKGFKPKRPRYLWDME
jgi:hypothetical protein